MYATDCPQRGYFDPEAGLRSFGHRAFECDEDDKHRKRRNQTLPVALKWAMIVCFAWGLFVVVVGMASRTSGANVSFFSARARLSESERGLKDKEDSPDFYHEREQENMSQSVQADDRSESPMGGEEFGVGEGAAPQTETESSWEGRMATGRAHLLKGIALALQELIATRGQSPLSALRHDPGPTSPDFSEALSHIEQSANVLAHSNSGELEIIERDYVNATTVLALLRLHEGNFDEVFRLVGVLQSQVDLDPEEKSLLALLQGYVHEAQGTDKAGMFFALAREYDPKGCHESLFDTSYQPPHYKLSAGIPAERPAYWPALADLFVFRELYTRQHALSPAASWPGTVWSEAAQSDKDRHGANIGWGLHSAGVARAADLFAAQDFVILREFLHPFELAVLERHYQARAQGGDVEYDQHLGRATSYQDRVGNFLNHRLTGLLNTIGKRPLKHAYSFLCHYERRNGVVPQLKPHTDREDNEVSVGAPRAQT